MTIVAGNATYVTVDNLKVFLGFEKRIEDVIGGKYNSVHHNVLYPSTAAAAAGFEKRI